ncbi:MAG: VTT domain-containing protein [Anaeroplasmataceae bacterium]|nr:VTT domain-containing protein [Anaeroplasmataceae bacterium]MDE6241270.1 VTT domain-containing protein [Anaeroplasmataceae bacterium]
MEEDKKKRYKMIRIVIQLVLIGFLLGLAIYACVELYPVFNRMQKDDAYLEEVLTSIRAYGNISWLILIGMQIIQTVLAIIPAGPVVILTGMLYPPVLAVIICLVGETLGALVVIGLVKLFGYSFLSLFVDPEKTKKFKLLEDGKRCGVLMFSYLLIPFLPKDPIAFIVPFTKVKVRYFVLINIFARLPMTVVSVIIGNSVITGNYVAAIIIASISFLLAILCFSFNKKIVACLDRFTSKKSETEVE